MPAEQAAAPCSLDCLASDVTDRQLVARLGERVEDVTVIEVRARLTKMLRNPGAIHRDRVSLEIRAGDSGWTLAESEPVIR